MGKKELSLKELQNIELEMLKSFHDFCEVNGLKYSLAGGTLLGAIRHQGFIPWDDDVDVIMPRPDYDKFISLVKNKKINDIYFLDDLFRPVTFVRLYDTRTEILISNYRTEYKIGCWLDVFALDGQEDDERKRKIHFKKMKFLTIMLIVCSTKFFTKRSSKMHTYLQYVLLPFYPIIRLIGYKRWYSLYMKLALKLNYNASEYIGAFEGIGCEKEAFLKQNIENRILVNFEGNKFYSLDNYDEYLTNLYGDYMSPPPIDKRIPKHEFKAYYKV